LLLYTQWEYTNMFNKEISTMGISSMQVLLLLIIIPLVLLPTIIAIKKNHHYKVPIIFINILGGLLWGVGWLPLFGVLLSQM